MNRWIDSNRESECSTTYLKSSYSWGTARLTMIDRKSVWWDTTAWRQTYGYLPSHAAIAVRWPLPNYTAWWQRHTCCKSGRQLYWLPVRQQNLLQAGGRHLNYVHDQPTYANLPTYPTSSKYCLPVRTARSADKLLLSSSDVHVIYINDLSSLFV